MYKTLISHAIKFFIQVVPQCINITVKKMHKYQYHTLFYNIFSAAVNSDTHEEVAIKKIANTFDNIIDAKRTLREIKLLRHMDHENVLF